MTDGEDLPMSTDQSVTDRKWCYSTTYEDDRAIASSHFHRVKRMSLCRRVPVRPEPTIHILALTADSDYWRLPKPPTIVIV
jgi:hypothetical protein